MPYIDPTTGDELTFQEWISWQAQGLIRRWSFIGIITVWTFTTWFLFKIWNHDPLDTWNMIASYLALLIESVVGIGVFSAMKRDAKAIRQIKAMEESMAAMLAHLEAREEKMAIVLDHIERLIEHMENQQE